MKKVKEKEKNYSSIIVGIVALSLVLLLIVFSLLTKKEDKPVIAAEKINVTTLSDNENKWDKTETIVVEVKEGVEASQYSFDGGINWQESNEYVATKNEKLVIIIKDINNVQSEEIIYETKNIDTEPPVISVSLPSTIQQNAKININDYVKVTDNLSGLNGGVTMEPSNLDTSKLGKQSIRFTAIDNAGNVSKITINLEVIKIASTIPEQPQNVVVYRYRTKNISNYECNKYDCSYYSDTDSYQLSETYVSTGKCDETLNKKYEFSSGCYISPKPMDVYCTQAFVTVDRYKAYGDDKNIVIDIFALDKNGKQQTNRYGDNYKAAPCGENEIEIYGYCHSICSRLSKECKLGYELVNGVCKKYVKKTCSDTCTKSTWSEWSEWSETKVEASETVQVETKIIKR